MPMTIYSARCREKPKVTVYPDRHVVTCADDLRQAVAFDHVCAEYEGNRRSTKNFRRSDCLPFDLDNSHSERPEDWKDLRHIMAAFPGVLFYVVPSRNHMKPKGDRAERPRYHVYFPIDEVTDANEYKVLKENVLRRFPWFDAGATDAARFFFGVEAPEVLTIKGSEEKTLTALLTAHRAPPAPDDDLPAPRTIAAGERNSTLSHLAGQLLTKYGDEDDQAHAEFDRAAARCEPPLDDDELETIWRSALGFYENTVKERPDYMPPKEYALQDFAPELRPRDFSDVGEARALEKLYGERLRYSDATGWLIYDGTRWAESDITARNLVHQLTERQLRQARDTAAAATNAYMKAQELKDDEGMKAAEQNKAKAEQLHKFAVQYRRSARITATLTEAAPYLQITPGDLDRDAFMLNTPAGAVDLRTGELRPHRPEDYCTKLTGCAPGSEGAELFADFLDKVTCGDRQLLDYLQLIAGMFAVGAVYREGLIIAYGGGGNGKSTLFNLLAYVLGDYAGGLSAETLTMNCRKNSSPEYAELRGKRLVIAAELEEGMRFDTAVIKKLCSSDPIMAEKKFKAPFSFIPSHTMVLYTNHLPKVGTVDSGTWDRLIVVPFKAHFRGQAGEVMNYGQYLFDHAGGAVLQWMIDGARRFIEAQYHIALPDSVRETIEEYRAENDWIQQFLENCCDIEPTYRQPSGDLYARYRQWCAQTGEYTRTAADFKRGIEAGGFEFRKTMTGNLFRGLRLKYPYSPAYDFAPAEDPLS